MPLQQNLQLHDNITLYYQNYVGMLKTTIITLEY